MSESLSSLELLSSRRKEQLVSWSWSFLSSLENDITWIVADLYLLRFGCDCLQKQTNPRAREGLSRLRRLQRNESAQEL